VLKDIVFIFEIHQPFRLRKDFLWENRIFKHIGKEEIFDHYFDMKVNKEIFERACVKCYFPSNNIILDLIDEFKRGEKEAKFSYSISGTFLEYCEKFSKDLLESFRQLSRTGSVEFLCQTYYHSLSSLNPEKDEFIEQVRMHQQAMRDLIGYRPKVFENTELIYNNAIAEIAERIGFEGIVTEGTERILGGRLPNFLYRPVKCERIKVILRNFKLTDDIGFRFSSRAWSEWPLTAPKYARWLAETPGDYICIFLDYETFGEHHWPETGIHEFLRHLPGEILKYTHLCLSTPSDVLKRHVPVGEIDFPEHDDAVSWADIRRDISGWLGNNMQWAYYLTLRRLEPFVKEVEDPDFLKIWRYFQTSDHLYYMYNLGGSPGEVHTYFSPYMSPEDAYIAAHSAALDLESRVRSICKAANEPFLFYSGKGKEHYTGIMVWSLKGFRRALQKIGLKSLRFHNLNGDFEKWAEFSLREPGLAKRFRKIRLSNLKGNDLRRALLEATENQQHTL